MKFFCIIIGIQEISHNPRDSPEARVPEVDRQEGPNSFTETRESVTRMAHEWVEHSEGRSLIAAVVGKPGVGKSTMINNVLGLEGETKCRVGECATVTTSRVQIHMNRLLDYNIDIPVALVDTPGLETFTPNMSTQDILKDLTRVTQGRADVLLYCISIHPACRINAADVEIIKSLNKAYGSQIWNHVILVLTFADRQAFWISEVIERFADRFQEALYSAHVTDVRVQSVFSNTERVGRVITAIPIGNDRRRTATFEFGHWYDLLLREIISHSDPTAAPQILNKKKVLSFKRD